MSVVQSSRKPARSRAISQRPLKNYHGVVLGMGGLMDLHLTAGSPIETAEVNGELERLADQLFESTRL